MQSRRAKFTDSIADTLAPESGLRAPALMCLCLAAAATVGVGVALLGPVLFLAALAAAVVALALLTDALHLLWAAVAVVLLLPFATLPVKIGITPTFLELALGGAFAVAVVAWVQRSDKAVIMSPVGWCLLLFMGLAVASFVLGVAHARPTVTSLRRFADMLLSLAAFYLVVNIITESASLQRTYRLVVVLGAGAAFVGVALYLLPAGLSERLLGNLGVVGYPSWGMLRYIEDNPEQAMRAIGTSVDPNVFGGMLAFIGGLLAPQAFVRRSRRATAVVWALLAVVGAALLLTFSRGSMFGLAVALGALGLVRHRRLMWLLLAATALVLILPPTRGYVQHFASGVRGDDLATQMRFGEYKDAFILISRYPWFGVGFTGVPDVDIYLGVSSVFLLIAEEMGLVGLAMFVVTMAAFFAYTWPRARMVRDVDPGLEAVLLGTQTAVLAGMVAGVLDHYLFNLAFPHAAALLWVTVGLGVAAARLAEGRLASDAVVGVA